MKLRLGYIVIYSNGVKEGSAGQTNGPVILIRPEYKDDKGLEAHEIEHVKQWWMTLGLHSILYLVFRQYRLCAELKAYKKQLRYAEDMEGSKRKFAVRLSTKYNLKITIEDAYYLLGG